MALKIWGKNRSYTEKELKKMKDIELVDVHRVHTATEKDANNYSRLVDTIDTMLASRNVKKEQNKWML